MVKVHRFVVTEFVKISKVKKSITLLMKILGDNVPPAHRFHHPSLTTKMRTKERGHLLWMISIAETRAIILDQH
jgi:hypothetical protein